MDNQPAHVLLVEDNDDHAELVIRQLSEHSVSARLTRVTDGQEALDYLLRNGKYTDPAGSPRPHVIFLDLRLPKVDGLEVIKVIKESEELRRIPIVVLTTSDAERDVTRAYVYHANSYVVKPVDFQTFRDLMHELGIYWLNWNTRSSA
ncbi:MAG: Response regulator rcp1 [Anaerolineales bacterium]|nr:Response regulator rcp1 [Anaerolineales bacterium]